MPRKTLYCQSSLTANDLLVRNEKKFPSKEGLNLNEGYIPNVSTLLSQDERGNLQEQTS